MRRPVIIQMFSCSPTPPPQTPPPPSFSLTLAAMGGASVSTSSGLYDCLRLV
jgi:hypothetical protein